MSVAEETKFDNPHLRKNNEPVYDEITAENLEVIGEIPTEVEGNFLRIGPNPYYVPDEALY
ncbi:carotenoid oxygenase family protein [Gammaproteobacteria bacterium]|nr:carotenoid oxygenase family protein [Gammaproteobacteria bacterium]